MLCCFTGNRATYVFCPFFLGIVNTKPIFLPVIIVLKYSTVEELWNIHSYPIQAI